MNGEVIWQASDSPLAKDLHDLGIRQSLSTPPSHYQGKNLPYLENFFSRTSFCKILATKIQSNFRKQFLSIILIEIMHRDFHPKNPQT